MSANKNSGSWYLDPLVAEQKRRVNQDLVRRWTATVNPRSVLKTDLFEEANGDDWILFDLFPKDVHAYGMDVNAGTVATAKRRAPRGGFSFAATDARSLAFRDGAFDVIVSNSTLDHFETDAEIHAALRELARVLKPGGTLVVTFDNPENPLYALLRWTTRHGGSPFTLGRTLSQSELNRALEQSGLQVVANEFLIYNPRLISTALFLALRRVLGRFADPPIRGLLSIFALLGKLPVRRSAACFVAACARKI